jgi:hypothetical protein
MSFYSTKQDIFEYLGFFWLRVFLDTDFVSGYSDSLAVQFNDLNNAFDRLPAYFSRYTIPIVELEDIHVFAFNEADLDRDAHHYGDPDLFRGDGSQYGSKLVRFDAYRFPFDTSYEPAFLATSYAQPAEILQKDVDYYFEPGYIVFKSNPLDLQTVSKFPRAQDTGVFFQFTLWGFKVERDIKAVQNYFGVIGGLIGDTSEQYKTAVNVVWDLRVEGATRQNITRLFAAATNTDYAEQDGTVTDIFVEGGRLCIQTENAVYSAPEGASAEVVVGQSVSRGDTLFDVFTIKQGKEEIDFEDFEGLTLGPGYLGNQYGGSLLFVNALVPVTREHAPGWTEVVKL